VTACANAKPDTGSEVMVKKIIVETIEHWHERGYSVRETVEQLKVPEAEVRAIISEYEKRKRA
jgi:hypothetical protein